MSSTNTPVATAQISQDQQDALLTEIDAQVDRSATLPRDPVQEAAAKKSQYQSEIQKLHGQSVFTVNSWEQLPFVMELLQSGEKVKLRFSNLPATEGGPNGTDLKDFVLRLLNCSMSDMISSVERKLISTGHEDLANVIREDTVYKLNRKDRGILRGREMIDVSKLDPASPNLQESVQKVVERLESNHARKFTHPVGLYTSAANQDAVVSALNQIKSARAEIADLIDHRVVVGRLPADHDAEPQLAPFGHFAQILAHEKQRAEDIANHTRLREEIRKLAEERDTRIKELEAKTTRRSEARKELDALQPKVEQEFGEGVDAAKKRKSLSLEIEELRGELGLNAMKKRLTVHTDPALGYAELHKQLEDLIAIFPATPEAQRLKGALIKFHRNILPADERASARAEVLKALEAFSPDQLSDPRPAAAELLDPSKLTPLLDKRLTFVDKKGDFDELLDGWDPRNRELLDKKRLLDMHFHLSNEIEQLDQLIQRENEELAAGEPEFKRKIEPLVDALKQIEARLRPAPAADPDEQP